MGQCLKAQSCSLSRLPSPGVYIDTSHQNAQHTNPDLHRIPSQLPLSLDVHYGQVHVVRYAFFCFVLMQVLDVRCGGTVHGLSQGHYGGVSCCAYSGASRDLFTGGDDGQLLAWSPAAMLEADEDE